MLRKIFCDRRSSGSLYTAQLEEKTIRLTPQATIVSSRLIPVTTLLRKYFDGFSH